MFGWLGALVFPARCIGCQRRGEVLCSACRAELPYLPANACTRCATLRGGNRGCRGCRQLSSALTRVRAPLAYAGAARAAVLTLKFQSGRYLAPLMGELLAQEARGMRAELIVPVPLSARRLRERGFNQAALLAQAVAPTLGGHLAENLLTRTSRPAQHTLGADARLKNLSGAFACAGRQEVAGASIVLVDDVVTTGATVSACADTLADAGASRITALAFARDL